MSEHLRPPAPSEQVTFTPGLIGLQSRLLLGETALNPSHDVAEHFNPNTIPSFENRDYKVFETASKSERTAYWNRAGGHNLEEQVAVWSHSLSSVISNKKFSDGEKVFYGRIGIDTDHFSAEEALEFYHLNFVDNPDKLKTFVHNAILAHSDEASGSIDYDGLMSNMGTITWFANIFGSNSAEIVGQLVDAEVKLMTNPTVFTQEPDQMNNLTDQEREILGFAWQFYEIPSTENQVANDNEVNTGDRSEIRPTEEHNPYEIADRLVNYETGRATGERIDILPTYSDFLDVVVDGLQNNHPLFQTREPKLVLSDVAYAMIDRVASRANDIEQELAFTIQGNVLEHEGRMVATGAYIAPASDFVNTRHSVVTLNPDINDLEGGNLALNTNLARFFQQTTGQGRGDMTGVLHIHHAALGDRWNIQPSRQDYQVAEKSIRNRDLPFFIWGVVTKSRDELGMRIFLSKPAENGTIVHDEIPVLYEYDLDHVQPIAA